MAGEDKPGSEDEGVEDPVYEAAAGWVARLSSSDATDADRDSFKVWLDADPAHAEAYAEMDGLWRRMGRIPDPRQRRKRKPTGLIALAAAILVGGLALQFGIVDRLRADLWTGVGAIEHVRLADGSGVDLNTDTALILRFTTGERAVDLLRGEAVFEVAHDASRPFVVRGGGLSVRAVGTRFYVSLDAPSEPVGVAQGVTEVTAERNRLELRSGEAARVEANGTLVAERADVERTTAWREGRLVFSDQPLSTVLAMLERYRRGRILLLDALAGQRRVSGTFDPRDTDKALDVLAATMGVKITRLTPLLVVVR